MSKITLPRLRKIIVEELSATVNEQVDHVGMRTVASKASELLEAIEEFREEATTTMQHAVTPHLAELEKILENMVSTPASYVEKKKVEPKKVSLKPVKAKKAL